MIFRCIQFSLLAALGGCQLLTGGTDPEPVPLQPADPNARMTLSGQTPTDGVVSRDAAIAPSARTTLLEDNEHLRDLLTKALEDKRALERKHLDSEDLSIRLDSQVRNQEDSITSLSEQIDSLQRQVAQLSNERDQLLKERKSLAEMFALEKRMRLAFEKELLEREIRERTIRTEDD